MINSREGDVHTYSIPTFCTIVDAKSHSYTLSWKQAPRNTRSAHMLQVLRSLNVRAMRQQCVLKEVANSGSYTRACPDTNY